MAGLLIILGAVTAIVLAFVAVCYWVAPNG
jgi:hypothetical protein